MSTPEVQHAPAAPLDLPALVRLPDTLLATTYTPFQREQRLVEALHATIALLRETHAMLGAARSWLADNCPVAVEVACDTVLAKVKDE